MNEFASVQYTNKYHMEKKMFAIFEAVIYLTYKTYILTLAKPIIRPHVLSM